MGSVRVTHDIDDLARDLARIPPRAAKDMAEVVASNINRGHKLAQGYARKASGPHGENYYKRITAEMLSPFSGEYGPEGDVVGNAVGAGWRGGPPNHDLERSLDIIGPNFEKMVETRIKRWFW